MINTKYKEEKNTFD